MLKNVVIRVQNSENPNPRNSKIGYLLPVYGFRNNRHRSGTIDRISDPRAKFGEIHNE